MRYFFIDLENVRSEGLEGVLSLREDDVVIIFYSENAMNISIPTLESINNSKAVKKYIKTNYIGKNAMDFQIVSLLGAMIEKNKKGGYYIISKDNGFRSAVSFCESYFAEYDIMAGVYPTIIVAITDEMKRSVKISDTNKKNTAKSKNHKADKVEKNDSDKKEEENVPVSSEVESAEQGVAKKKRRRRKSSKNKNEAVQENAESEDLTVENEVAEEVGIKTQTEAFGVKDKTKTETADKQKPKSENVSAKEKPKTENPTEEAKPEVNKFEYIYNTLGELLSEKTISLYAESIDEAIGGCKNKDELHEFFRNRYGEDEGEALYRVTQGDFENMKQLRPAKAHKPGRRRHRSGRKHPANKDSQ